MSRERQQKRLRRISSDGTRRPDSERDPSNRREVRPVSWPHQVRCPHSLQCVSATRAVGRPIIRGCDTPSRLGAEGTQERAEGTGFFRCWRRRAAAATEPVLMAYPPAQPGGLASLVGATPLPSPDGSLAVLVADLSFASTLQDIGRSSAEGEDISSLIAFHALQERTLAPLARRGEADVMGLSANPPPELMDGLADGASGLLRQTLGGREYLIAFAPLANRELYLLLARPVDNLLGPVSEAQARVNRRIEQQIMVGGMSLILLLIAAVLLSFIGARSITRPVKELKAVARRIADGDLNARCHLQTGDELEDLGNTFNEMLPKLNERLKMQDALGLAMEVQQKLLPDQAPSVAGFDIAGRSMYCDETGGDYYDFLELNRLDSRQVGIAVGDVTGHGIAAALLMASARAMLRSHAGESSDLSKMMTSINRHLSGDAHAGRFMTLFYGVLDGVKKTIRWVSAGHAPAILFDPASGQFMELPGRDIPLGIDGSWAYHEEIRFGWTAGQILAIGTDGIWEMRNKKGEMFGMDLLREVIRDNAALSAEDICEAVAQSLDVHRGLRDQEDDVTLVVVKFLE